MGLRCVLRGDGYSQSEVRRGTGRVSAQILVPRVLEAYLTRKFEANPDPASSNRRKMDPLGMPLTEETAQKVARSAILKHGDDEYKCLSDTR